MPAALRAATKPAADPSRPGGSGPSSSISQLSIRSPARAASRCSTSVTPLAGGPRVVRRTVPVTNSARAGIGGRGWPIGSMEDEAGMRGGRPETNADAGPGNEAHALDFRRDRQRPLVSVPDHAHGVCLSGILPEFGRVLVPFPVTPEGARGLSVARRVAELLSSRDPVRVYYHGRPGSPGCPPGIPPAGGTPPPAGGTPPAGAPPAGSSLAPDHSEPPERDTRR